MCAPLVLTYDIIPYLICVWRQTPGTFESRKRHKVALTANDVVLRADVIESLVLVTVMDDRVQTPQQYA